ncbi:hypothetical protein AC1031_002225 [Aphanomyces cochlioides]|nr:hypothetical protein AC1031_002225 [Aphanomyces cochlioides]
MTFDAWNIEEDLGFLLAASEEELDDEHLAEVCSLLCSNKTANLAGQSSVKRLKRRRIPCQVRQRQEVESLRAQLEALTKTLHSIDINSKTLAHMPFWKRMAHLECIEKTKAKLENESLRSKVDEQAEYIDELQKRLLKKPKLCSNYTTEWQSYCLAAQSSRRVAGIHAISDRQLQRMNHAFLRAGLLDQSRDITTAEMLCLPDGSMQYQIVNHVTFEVPSRLIAAAVWNAIGGRQSPTLPRGVWWKRSMLRQRYSRIVDARDPAMTWHSNIIRKVFRHEDREIIVVRTVLDDALVPRQAADRVENKWAWIQIVAEGHEKCRVTFLVQADLGSDSTQLDSAEELNARHKSSGDSGCIHLSINFNPLAPLAVDKRSVPYASLKIFLEHFSRIRTAVNGALSKALEAYQRDKS